MSRWPRWLARFVVIALAAATTACSAAPLVGQKVSGRVIDMETGEAVAGAYVLAYSGRAEYCRFDLHDCDCLAFDIAVTRTDANGRYRFEQRFHFGLLPMDKFGRVQVYAPGYVTAPKWVGQNWTETIPGTPAEHVASVIPPQYFYGTADYRNHYERRPLTEESDTYYLTRRPIPGWDPKAPPDPAYRDDARFFARIRGPTKNDYTPRVLSLFHFANTLGGTACEYNEEDIDYESLVFPILRAIYHEAARFAETEKDFEYLHRICMEAMGLSWPREADKPCEFSAASKH